MILALLAVAPYVGLLVILLLIGAEAAVEWLNRP